MLRGGAFDDIAAAMMVHASPSGSFGKSSPSVSSRHIGYTGRRPRGSRAALRITS